MQPSGSKSPLCARKEWNDARETDDRSLAELWEAWEQEGRLFWQEMDALVEMLDNPITVSSG
jgi:hypothetical protein